MNSISPFSPYLLLNDNHAKAMKEQIPPETELSRLSLFFKMFGDQTRLRILFFLSHKELCVGDLAALMDMTPSAVSHQLKLLKSTELVRFRREGKILLYSLSDGHVKNIIKIGLEHAKE